MNAQAHLSEFLNELGQNRAYSQHTLNAYERDILQFLTHLEQEGLGFRSLDRRNVQRYLAKLRQQGQSSRSIQRKSSSLRSFYRWLLQEDLLSETR